MAYDVVGLARGWPQVRLHRPIAMCARRQPAWRSAQLAARLTPVALPWLLKLLIDAFTGFVRWAPRYAPLQERISALRKNLPLTGQKAFQGLAADIRAEYLRSPFVLPPPEAPPTRQYGRPPKRRRALQG